MLLRKLKCLLFLFLIFFAVGCSFSQNIDSLYTIYNNKTQPDTMRLNAIHEIAIFYLYNNPDTTLILAKQELELAKVMFNNAKKNTIKQAGKKWQANSLNIMGASFQIKSDYPRALDYYLRALKLREEILNKQGIATSLNNIGNIYYYLKDYQKGIDYYLRSLKMQEEIGNKYGIAMSLNNIGNSYKDMLNNQKALVYFTRSLKIQEDIGDKEGLANSLGNIGVVYCNLSKYQEALDYGYRSLQIKEEIGDKQGTAYALSNIGNIYLKQKQYVLALQYSNKALQTVKEIGDFNLEKSIHNILYEIYKSLNKPTKALVHFERFVLLKDSIFKEENQKQIMRKEMNYEYEKKDALAKLEQEKKDALLKEEKVKQRIILLSVILGLFVVIVFSIFLYNRFRITHEQKSIIEKQKDLIEEHQKSVIDSITYAKRIQDAILPPTDLIKEKLPDSFVLFKPKDIVAGDFYWMEEINNTILIAAADCTGHGVPGAIVSVVCSNALNRAVKEFHLVETGAILDKVTDLVLETFEKSTAEVKDGMDISMLSINKANRQIQWSGANNPLWYFNNKELKVITADKQPIGKSDHRKPFTTHTIEYNPDTTFYLFTDGYADQFGGPKGKKFMYKQFQETLSATLHNKPSAQHTALNKAFENWKGELEQVDDICVIGISI